LQQLIDALAELQRTAGLGQEHVVAVEAAAHLVFVQTGVHGDHGRPRLRVLAQRATHGQAIQARHVDIQDNEIE
jgi:hypothetical protein